MDVIQPYISYIISFLLVIGLIIVLALVLKSFTSRTGNRRGNRLSVTEYREISKNRTLVLIRRDDTEHLLLIGGSQDLVVETGIYDDEADDELAPSAPIARHPAPAYQEAPFPKSRSKPMPVQARDDRAEPRLRPVDNLPPPKPRRNPTD